MSDRFDPDREQSDGERLSCEIGVPSMLVGSNALIMWLASIRVKVEPQQLRYIKESIGLEDKRWAEDTRMLVYEAEDIERIVERVVGVSAKAWLQARSKDAPMPPHIMRARMVKDHAVMLRNGTERMRRSRESFEAYALLEVIPQEQIGLPGGRRPFERVALEPHVATKRLAVATSRTKAEKWNLETISADFGGRSVCPRIVRYSKLMRASAPRTRPDPSIDRKHFQLQRGALLARTLLAVYHINDDGQMSLCRVPAKFVGHPGVEDPVLALIGGGSPLKNTLGEAIRHLYHEAYWFSWERGVEVQQTTLIPKLGSVNPGKISVKLSESALAGTDDPKQLFNDLEDEDL